MGGSHERTLSSMAGHGGSPERKGGEERRGDRAGVRLRGVGREGGAPGGI
jgi:hypothetical protein